MGPTWVLPAPDGPHVGPMSLAIRTCISKGFMGQHGAHLGPADPRWAPCWPHEPCYQDMYFKRIHGPTWGPPGSCRPQMGPMLAPWTLLSGHGFQKDIFNLLWLHGERWIHDAITLSIHCQQHQVSARDAVDAVGPTTRRRSHANCVASGTAQRHTNIAETGRTNVPMLGDWHIMGLYFNA